METHYGGTIFHAYICTKHPNEKWDTNITSADGAPYCIPCEMKRLRADVDHWRGVADNRSRDNYYLNKLITRFSGIIKEAYEELEKVRKL